MSMKVVKDVLWKSGVTKYGNISFKLRLECGHETMRTLKWDEDPRERKFRCMKCLTEKWKKETKNLKDIRRIT